MSSPDSVNEWAHWLQDNLADYLWNADRPVLAELVEKLMPHISSRGVQEIYPLVSEVYPPRSLPMFHTPPIDDDDEVINYGGTK